MDNVSAMLPPEKVAAVWIRKVPGLSASPLLRFVRKIAEATNDKSQGHFRLLRDVLTSSTTTDAPPQISQLILEIRDLLVGAIKLTETLSDISPLEPDEKELVEKYGKSFGVSKAFLCKLRQPSRALSTMPPVRLPLVPGRSVKSGK
jgi:hypothetical protein